MPFHLISYATTKYRHRQIFLTASALANGVVDSADTWNPRKLLAAGFRETAPDISLSEHGSGFWAWKPFVILLALEAIPDGDIALYCDAGRKFPYILLDTDLDCFLKWMEDHDQDIMPGISIPWNGPMSVWTKNDAFVGTGMGTPEVRNMSPTQASFSFWRNTAATREFVREWLGWCVQRNLVSDDPSTSVAAESPEFKAHRHDQSLLNLCCYKHGIIGLDIGTNAPLYNERDPAQVSAHVFGARKQNRTRGTLLSLLVKPIQIIEQCLRERISFGRSHP